MKRTVKTEAVIDWSVADAMTDEQRHAAAMADPDAVPMTDEEWAEAPRVAQVKTIRRALKLSQEEFAASFHIPIGTLRDWEQGRKEPDAAARAYLRVIAHEPDVVRKALRPADVNRAFTGLRCARLLVRRFLVTTPLTISKWLYYWFSCDHRILNDPNWLLRRVRAISMSHPRIAPDTTHYLINFSNIIPS